MITVAEEEEPTVATVIEEDDDDYRAEEPPRTRKRGDQPRRRRDREETEDIGRSMPGGVILAIVALSILLALELLFGTLSLTTALFRPEDLPRALGQMIGTVVIGGLILWGLIVGHRLAWQWGRVLAMFGAVLMLLFAVIFAAAPAQDFTPTVRFIMAGAGIVFSTCLFTISFSLGTTAAKEFFRLRCPSCGRFTNAAADFFFNEAKCKRCRINF